MDPITDSSVRERLKSRRATRSDRHCIRETFKAEGFASVKDSLIDPKKNPISSITYNLVAHISRTFGLPLSGLRIPSAAERPTDVGPEEIVVYEALFSYDFRGIVPSLVAEVSRYLGLSSGQLFPMVWRMLMALEVMGDLNSIEVSVASVLYAFYFKPYADIGHLSKGDDAAGKRTIEELLEIHSERRSLEFLSSHLALERNVIWDCNMSESQRASAPNPFELFLAASGKLAEMGSSAPASESHVRVIEVPKGGIVAVGKRKVEHTPGDRMESQRENISSFSVGEIGSSHSSSWVEEMKNKLLSWDMEAIAEGGAGLATDEVCRTLLKVIFFFRIVEAKLYETVEESSKDHEAFVLMREMVSVAGHEQAKEELQQKVAKLMKDDELKDKEVKSLKRKNELLQDEYDFFLGGSAVITRWETIKEYLTGQHLTWDLEGIDRRYAQVVKAQAQFKGLSAPEVVESLVALNSHPS
ncbi:unnamed protein product [Cochlearia groenlandica]